MIHYSKKREISFLWYIHSCIFFSFVFNNIRPILFINFEGFFIFYLDLSPKWWIIWGKIYRILSSANRFRTTLCIYRDQAYFIFHVDNTFRLVEMLTNYSRANYFERVAPLPRSSLYIYYQASHSPFSTSISKNLLHLLTSPFPSHFEFLLLSRFSHW